MFENESTNALDVLKKDHRRFRDYFKRFEQTEDVTEKMTIARAACHELKIHSEIEEEIFYPAIRGISEEIDAKVGEGIEEHHVGDLLIEELDAMESMDEQFEAKFKVLTENMEHHLEEEEHDMFPKVKSIDLDEVGARLIKRQEELFAASDEKLDNVRQHTADENQKRSA